MKYLLFALTLLGCTSTPRVPVGYEDCHFDQNEILICPVFGKEFENNKKYIERSNN